MDKYSSNNDKSSNIGRMSPLINNKDKNFGYIYLNNNNKNAKINPLQDKEAKIEINNTTILNSYKYFFIQ